LYCLSFLAIVLSLLFGRCIVYPFWPLYCLSFLAIVLSILFGHCIVSPFWPWYCLSFLAVVLSHLFGHCIVYPFSIYGFWLSFWYYQTFEDLVVGQFFIFSFYRFHSVFCIFIL
jgi:hypothetical protein